MEITVKNNDQFGSIELYFSSKPSEAVREALKALKFRWHGLKKCWYGNAEKSAVLEAVANAQAGKQPEKQETTAPAAVNATEPVKGLRDYERDIKEGDVVTVEGATGTSAKAVNGIYFVRCVSEWANGEKDFQLQGLKKDRGSVYEGIAKKTIYWPLHCYHNNRDVVAQFKENTKNAVLRGLGPISGAVYSKMAAELKEAREHAENSYFRDEELARVEKDAGELARIETENPGLKEFAAKLDAKFAQTGPGLKILKNGLSVRQKDGTWDFSALTIRKCGENVTIYSHWGDSSRGCIPGGFALDIKNDTDSQTDYFDTDSATVTPAHPLYKRFVAAAEGSKPYELTDEDADNLGKYRQAKKEAKEAEEEAERAEYAENRRKFDEFAAESVRTWEDSFPWAPGCGPSVVVEWSEVGALHEGSEEDANENGGVAKRYSVDAFDRITADLDRWMKEHDRGYYKVKFTVEFPDEMPSYTDRIDVGDGLGGIIGMLKSTVKYHEEKGEGGDVMTGFGGHSLDEVREVLRRLEEATDGEAREIDDFLDSLAW